jgi:Transposase
VVAAGLAAAGLPVVVVNPAQVRAFAQALGKRAKTDPIDAEVIAHFAEVTKPKLRQLADETTGLLADLVARRRQIVEMIAAEGQRARRMSDKRLTKSVARLRKALEKELSELDALIGNQIRGSTLWAEKENHPPSRHYLVGARREAAGKRAPTQPVILGPPRLSLERQILLLVIGRPFVELPLQPCCSPHDLPLAQSPLRGLTILDLLIPTRSTTPHFAVRHCAAGPGRGTRRASPF